MSRIEKALEKAALLREGTSSPEPSARTESAQPVRVSAPPFVPPAGTGYSSDSPLLVTLSDGQSAVAEEYRKLKSFLVSITRTENFRNTLMVTSALGGEGKSLTSVNLAITLAHEFDHTVLLVDADLRKPSISSYLGIEPKLGLVDCLRNGADLSDVLIRPGIGKLTVLPAGRAVGNPTELLASQKMRELVQEMKSRYPDRYIIIDTPPILPFAETHAISQIVDGVLFVVREGVASMRNITEAMQSLKSANVLGVVYNGASQDEMGSRYGYYGYRYGSADNGSAPGEAGSAPSVGAPGKGKKGFFRKMMSRSSTPPQH